MERKMDIGMMKIVTIDGIETVISCLVAVVKA